MTPNRRWKRLQQLIADEHQRVLAATPSEPNSSGEVGARLFAGSEGQHDGSVAAFEFVLATMAELEVC